MEIQRISLRGRLVTFNDPYRTNTVLILTEDQVVVCDTFCGPDSMKKIRSYLEAEKQSEKQFVIFNSHYHYDHIWGNCEFKEESIYAHTKCYELIAKYGKRNLEQYSEHMKGNVTLTYPNQLFSSSAILDNGRIRLFHSPGHTLDSSSCIDYEDGILFVGDNIESPIPYIYNPDLDLYIATLMDYLSMDWKFLISGHDPLMTDATVIHSNIEYLEGLRDWSIELKGLDDQTKSAHLMNFMVLVENLNQDDVDENVMLRVQEALSYLKAIELSETTRNYISILESIEQ